MSSADRRETAATSAYWLHTWPRRYGFALITVAMATLLRFALTKVIGANVLFVLFYPAILLVAWTAGLAPAVFAVVLSTLSAKYFFFGLVHPAVLGLPHNANGLLLFTAAGIGISVVTDIYRRRARRLAEFETAIDGLDEMIAVVDRKYRYVIANRAFLNIGE